MIEKKRKVDKELIIQISNSTNVILDIYTRSKVRVAITTDYCIKNTLPFSLLW